MMNRELIFTAIQAQTRLAQANGSSVAVVIMRVRGLRDITLRFG